MMIFSNKCLLVRRVLVLTCVIISVGQLLETIDVLNHLEVIVRQISPLDHPALWLAEEITLTGSNLHHSNIENVSGFKRRSDNDINEFEHERNKDMDYMTDSSSNKFLTNLQYKGIQIITSKIGFNNSFQKEINQHCSLIQSIGIVHSKNNNTIFCYSELPLFIQQRGKFPRHVAFVTESTDVSSRTGGYWFFKSALLQYHAYQSNDGDFLVWIDDDRIDFLQPSSTFLDIMDTLSKRGDDLFIENVIETHKRNASTKIDSPTISLESSNSSLRPSPQVNASAFIVRNSPQMRKFLDAWVDCASDWHRKSSAYPNSPNFYNNTFDQQILGRIIHNFLSRQRRVGSPARTSQPKLLAKGFTYRFPEAYVEPYCPFESHGDTMRQTYPHPHAGARDSSGQWGYHANVTALRSWMLQKYCSSTSINKNNLSCDTRTILPFTSTDEMNHVCQPKPGEGNEGPEGWDILVNRITVSKQFDNPSAKILCALYTHEPHHANVYAIGATWGWRCDGFFAASTQTVARTNENDEPPIEIIDLPFEGPAQYTNMWQKTRSILSYMHDHYINDFEYFYLAGDDTHLIVENLKKFLLDHRKSNIKYNDTKEDGILFGGQTIYFPDYTGKWQVYSSGGSGYVMSRRALQRLVQKAFPRCHVHEEYFAEDLRVGDCMKQVNILPLNIVDNFGKHLFHGYSTPQNVADSLFTVYGWQWTRKLWKHLDPVHFNFTTGIDYISQFSVAFHQLKSVIDMKRHHAVLYKGGCPGGTILGDAFVASKHKEN